MTDVWLPAVLDSDPLSSTYNTMVRPHWHYEYDARGNELSQTDPKGNVTTWTYDEKGNQATRTLPADSDGTTADDTERWTYDSFGRMLTHVDFKSQTTAYHYDDAPAHGGREDAEYRFGSGVTALDGSGNILTANATEETAYGYDSLGRQNSVTEYANGNLTMPVRSTTTTFDPISGNIASVTSPEGTIHYEYDPATGNHTRTYADSNDTSYDYDSQGRLWHVTVALLNGSSVNLVTTYTHDLSGNLHTQVDPNGVTTTYTYDDLNRLTNEVVSNSSGNLFTQDFTLQDDGQRDYVIEKRYDGSSSTPFSTTKIDWSYDDDGRLTSETRDQDPTPADGTDDFGTQEGSDYTDTFKFDLTGNRVNEMHDEVGTANDTTTAYSYNDRDELRAEGPDTNSDGVPDAATATNYEYDPNGSQTSVAHPGGGTDTYTYDLRNKMVSVTINGVTTTYVYDSDGNRASETTNGVTTYYETDKKNPTGYVQPIEEKSSRTGGATRSYILGLSVLGQADAGGTFYYMTDGHGSNRGLLDSSGAVTSTFDYKAFGGAIGFDPNASGTPAFLFGGDAIYDPASGLYFHGDGTRPREGFRFLQGDPRVPGAGDVANSNLYMYVGGNPVNRIDPSGHDFLTTLGAVGIMATIAGIFGGIEGILVHHSIRGAIAGFADSFTAVGTSLLILPELAVLGPAAIPISWGFGSAAGKAVELMILDGGVSALWNREAVEEISASFIVGGLLGSFASESSQYLQFEIEREIEASPGVWNALGDLASHAANRVWPEATVEENLTQSISELFTLYRPVITNIGKELLGENAKEHVKDGLVQPVVQFIVHWIGGAIFEQQG